MLRSARRTTVAAPMPPFNGLAVRRGELSLWASGRRASPLQWDASRHRPSVRAAAAREQWDAGALSRRAEAH